MPIKKHHGDMVVWGIPTRYAKEMWNSWKTTHHVCKQVKFSRMCTKGTNSLTYEEGEFVIGFQQGDNFWNIADI